MTNLNPLLGEANFLLVTFDCLRHDTALVARLPFPLLWEKRETPGTFTLPAHLAFFHGFLPTPTTSGPHPRLFALKFDGSLSTSGETLVFDDVPDIVAGFAARGYRTFCVGGVGFFNKLNPLGHVLPGYFQESAWSPALGVANPRSAEEQIQTALDWLSSLPSSQRFFLFINISATHPPHAHYIDSEIECVLSQVAALEYAAAQLPRLMDAIKRRGPCFCMMMGDHGEAYGEDGRWGHRIAHPVVTTVPYADFLLDRSA